MNTFFYHLAWLFLIYSFLGWVLETGVAAVKQRHFANRGLVNSPFCIMYGVAACLVSVFFNELRGGWLFAAAVIISTVLEWTVGHLIEVLFHERWWDYSNRKWNLDGYICLSKSLLRGVFVAVAVIWGNDFLLALFQMLPKVVGRISVWAALGLLTADVLATAIILNGRSKNLEKWESVDQWMDSVSSRAGRFVYGMVNRRIGKAYPQARRHQVKEKNSEVFAFGCDFYKIFWLFVIGAFLGDIVETIFCRFSMGYWMSISSLVWGPFSIVWGGGIAGATLLLHRYRDRSDSFIFLTGTVLGGAYEYFCSVFSEKVFGKVFWDYSAMKFNLGGRINLLYCFFWGIAAVVWIKILYPVISGWIEKIPMKAGKIVTWVMVVFLSCDMLVSSMALVRSDQRKNGVEASAKWQIIMDQVYDDERLKPIYPNAIDVSY